MALTICHDCFQRNLFVQASQLIVFLNDERIGALAACDWNRAERLEHLMNRARDRATRRTGQQKPGKNNDLTSVHEKCAAEHEALRKSANDYITFVNSYEPSSFLRRENNGLYELLQAYADQFRDALGDDIYSPTRPTQEDSDDEDIYDLVGWNRR